ncbi:alkaline phosphatase family protein [Aquirufa antheringensis]|uniref:alkaline phosphatase D family protein n=1 Tax=Aquirufa antheringensis TaxID=2516559 RepID=UPI0022A86155|nr:alkaline phosphatase D family protein [Aquirufa antheringensis]MCZ2476560.1 alkaline phosphatase family protein [Aquirufa antheringensis]
MKRILIALFLTVPLLASAQIKSGPMLGYSEMKEVLVWVQTEKPADVSIQYWEKGDKTIHKTDPVHTEKTTAFIARIIADEVTMGKKYAYEVLVNGKKMAFDYPLEFQTQELWQYRKDPPAFSFLFGTCNYVNEEATDRPGRPYGGADEVYAAMYAKKPDFMLWGGDNFYYREPDYTRTGMIHRNDHARAVKSMQPLLGSVHQYAIWDDHDYGPNDADRSFPMKYTSLEMFKMYWGNPNFAFPNEGITGKFQWADVEFFLMDDRWNKAPNELNDPNKDYWGAKQMTWLLDQLSTSRASFKIIVNGGQVVSPAKVFENMANYEAERTYLLKELKNRKIPGVLFFTGDRHISDLNKLEREGTYPLYDLTVSPMTAGKADAVKQDYNETLVPGTLVQERAFSKIEVTGPLKDRTLTITLFNVKGDVLWTKELKSNLLK